MMFTFWAESAVGVVWPSPWLIVRQSLKGWVGVSGTNLDWRLWLDFFQLIDWMRHVCRFSSWVWYCSLYVGYATSILFVQWSKLHSLFFLLLDSLDSYNEIIVPQMKLFCCGFLFTIAFKICWCLIFYAGSGLKLYWRSITTYSLMVQLGVYCSLVNVLLCSFLFF